jgi:histone-lysine N-methyltransferase SETMAR
MIQAKKKMATIAWNPHGFHVVDTLPKWESFNITYYIKHILWPILEHRPKLRLRQFIIYADNARLYAARKSRIFCKSNSIKIAPHLPYSPDLAPSDFFFLDMSSIA